MIGTVTSVNAMAVVGNSLYLAGWFATAGGVTVKCIARWDGAAFSALSMGGNVGLSTEGFRPAAAILLPLALAADMAAANLVSQVEDIRMTSLKWGTSVTHMRHSPSVLLTV